MLHKKTIRHLLLLFYLFSSFVSATHIHHDKSNVHSECKICTISNNMLGANLDSPTLYMDELPYITTRTIFSNQYNSHTILKGYDAHAPPYFS